MKEGVLHIPKLNKEAVLGQLISINCVKCPIMISYTLQFKRQLDKDHKIRCSNWEKMPLSNQQMQYAATDAYVRRKCSPLINFSIIIMVVMVIMMVMMTSVITIFLMTVMVAIVVITMIVCC